MKRISLYSSSDRARKVAAPSASGHETDIPASPIGAAWRARLRALALQYEKWLFLLLAVFVALALVLGHAALKPPPRPLTQEDIDAAVLHTLETAQIPSHAAKAYEAVRRSVVRVRGTGYDPEQDGHVMEGVGTGVVIVDTGIILTNLHVIAGAEHIQVEFSDGTESDATVIGARPENDLAVLQAKTLPDDLPAATLRSTARPRARRRGRSPSAFRSASGRRCRPASSPA